jgi:hypothetical protein
MSCGDRVPSGLADSTSLNTIDRAAEGLPAPRVTWVLAVLG